MLIFQFAMEPFQVGYMIDLTSSDSSDRRSTKFVSLLHQPRNPEKIGQNGDIKNKAENLMSGEIPGPMKV